MDEAKPFEIFASFELIAAPANVPIACARNGNKKYLRGALVASTKPVSGSGMLISERSGKIKPPLLPLS